jgi:hypothetical protein
MTIRRSTHRPMVMHIHTKYHWPISNDKNVMARTTKYYLKKHYLTSRSKVKVPQWSLRYATHRLMVMHPHTKYYWSISKDKKYYGQDKKILFKKQLFDLHVKGQGPTKVITVCDTPPYGHAPTYQISLTYHERNNYLTLRSKVKIPRRSGPWPLTWRSNNCFLNSIFLSWP